MAGGLAGAKLLWVVEHLGEDRFTDLLFARGGLSWYGGLIGGPGAGVGAIGWHGWPLVPTLAAATPAQAFGHPLGRIGCFLVGDDYGRPTDLPWGVAFPEGLPPTSVPVHPTQLYEAALLGVIGYAVVALRRRGSADRAVLGVYLTCAGAVRFTIEFVRINERVWLGLTVAHILSLVMAAVGAMLIVTAHPKVRRGIATSSRRFT